VRQEGFNQTIQDLLSKVEMHIVSVWTLST